MHEEVSRMTTKLLLVFLVFILHFSFSLQRSIPARCSKAFLDPVNVAKQGYCWKFSPLGKRVKDAADYCKGIGGHLITLNSKSKAKLLGKFVKDSIKLTTKDYFGKEVGKYYRKLTSSFKSGYNPWITISSVYSTQSKTTWTATGKEVKWDACIDRKGRKNVPGVTRCPAFTGIPSRWLFMHHCRYAYAFVCEQGLGPDDKAGEAKTTTTPKPTTTTKPTTRKTTTTTTTRAPTTTTTTQPTTTTTDDYYDYYDDGYYYYK